MPFIDTIAPAAATGPVKELYDAAEKRVGHVPNWALGFSLHPEVWRAWDRMHAEIRTNLSLRMYELATLAAARALRSSYCSLAHGAVLATKVFDADGVAAIVEDPSHSPLEPGELALMAFAQKVAMSADQVSQQDVDGLRAHGYSDTVIFDVAATAAARCFFSKLLDALGVQADAKYGAMDPKLRAALTVGRPVAGS